MTHVLTHVYTLLQEQATSELNRALLMLLYLLRVTTCAPAAVVQLATALQGNLLRHVPDILDDTHSALALAARASILVLMDGMRVRYVPFFNQKNDKDRTTS